MASVGPYRLTASRPRTPASRVHSDSGTASPPKPTTASGQCPSGPISPLSASWASRDGVTSMKSIARSRRKEASSSGSRRVSSSTRCRACPSSSQSCGCQEASKENDQACATRRCRRPVRALARSYRSCRWLWKRLARPRWVTTTPLGRPVEPEVWMT